MIITLSVSEVMVLCVQSRMLIFFLPLLFRFSVLSDVVTVMATRADSVGCSLREQVEYICSEADEIEISGEMWIVYKQVRYERWSSRVQEIRKAHAV